MIGFTLSSLQQALDDLARLGVADIPDLSPSVRGSMLDIVTENYSSFTKCIKILRENLNPLLFSTFASAENSGGKYQFRYSFRWKDETYTHIVLVYQCADYTLNHLLEDSIKYQEVKTLTS